MKGKISVRSNNKANRINKKLTFKKNAPIGSCISKINNTSADSAENLDIVMPLYTFVIIYSDNYSMTTKRFWNYYGDEVNDDENENDNADNRINNKKKKTITSKSFEYKTKLIGSTPK